MDYQDGITLKQRNKVEVFMIYTLKNYANATKFCGITKTSAAQLMLTYSTWTAHQ